MKEHKDGEQWTICRAADFLEHYASYIGLDVTVEDIERHPYLPEVEYVASQLRDWFTPDSVASREAPPALFPREKFSGYTDNQVKYIRIGWNAAMRFDGVRVGPLGDGAERRVEAFASGRLAEIQGCPRGCGSLGQCKANAYGTPDHCPARTAGVSPSDGEVKRCHPPMGDN